MFPSLSPPLPPPSVLPPSPAVNSQMALCKPELFQLLTSFLHDPRESLTVKCTSAFLANVLVCNNSTGQRLARDTTLLKTLMDIFRFCSALFSEMCRLGVVHILHSAS